MAGNVIVTSTVNKVQFDVDNGSYSKAVKKIRSLKREWEKTGEVLNKGKKDPSKAYASAAAQMKKVNTRLEQTRRAEATKSTNHAIALAKRQARETEAVRKQSAARVARVMSAMTAKDPEMAKMRKFYKDLEKGSKKMPEKAWGRGRPFSIATDAVLGGSLAAAGGGGVGGGHFAPKSNYTGTAAANADMARTRIPKPEPTPAELKAIANAAKAKAKAENDVLVRERRRQDTIGQTDVRLRAKLGPGYSSKLGAGMMGNMDRLNKQFSSGAISVGRYRAEVAALERQFRTAQNGAYSLGDSLKGIRSTLVGVTAAYGAFNSGASILKQGQFFQGLDATMSMVSDSSEEAGKRVQFVKDQSYRLGLDIEKAAQGYTQMSIAADGVISKSQNDELFKGFAEYSTALQVSPVKFERGITAIQQMMGKGTIMSEELKQQLAEGIPGSMQVFVKAAQKFFKDDKIGTEQLMDLMKSGKLLAKDILPLVGEEYAKAANKGDALTKALKGNRVAMQRLKLTWVEFQNKLFEGGFGDSMTKIFNDLAHILDSNGSLATNLGRFFSNMIDGAWDMATRVYNTFVWLGLMMDHIAEELGIKSETIQKALDWAAYTAGAILFLGAMGRLLGILQKIVGLRAALQAVRQSVTMGGAAAAAGGAGTVAPAATKLLPAFKGVLGKIIAPYMLYSAAQDFPLVDVRKHDEDAKNRLAAGGYGSDLQGVISQYSDVNKSSGGLSDIFSGIGDWWSSEQQKKNQAQLDWLVRSGNAPSGTSVTPPFLAQAPVEKGTITVKIEAGELNKMIDVAIDKSELHRLNLIMGVKP